jgi:hypothetical protein
MALPPRVFYTLQEVSVRWDCSLSDIAGWASVGRFDIVTAIAPVIKDARILAGFVAVSVPDILQLVRRSGTGPGSCRLWRVRPMDQDDWIVLPDHGNRADVALEDLLIMADDVRRFENDCNLLHRPATNTGFSTWYDWDAMYVALIQRVHDHGVPESQSKWVGEVQSWFVKTSETGEAPDERSIRRRLTPIWKALRGPG